MANELYIHTLRQLRDGCEAEHMDTETAALEAAIKALSYEGDCISRQAAIDAANSRKTAEQCEAGKTRNWTIDICVDMIKQLPSAQPEPQWIPCERNLPEDYTDVLAWFEYFRYGDYNCLYQTYGIGSYSMEYDSWMINHETGWRKLRVIAWMPLPEPWRGEEQ